MDHSPTRERRPGHESRWQGPESTAPAPLPRGYEFRIEGHLDEHWSTWFDGLALTHDDDGTTTLRGFVADQAELHGLLAKVRDLGVTLVSVMPIDPGSR